MGFGGCVRYQTGSNLSADGSSNPAGGLRGRFGTALVVKQGMYLDNLTEENQVGNYRDQPILLHMDMQQILQVLEFSFDIWR